MVNYLCIYLFYTILYSSIDNQIMMKVIYNDCRILDMNQIFMFGQFSDSPLLRTIFGQRSF